MARTPKANTIYEVMVNGLYYSSKDGKTELKQYEVTAKLNDKHREAGFLYVFKNHVLPEVLPKMYPDYNGVQTHNLVWAKDTANPDRVLSDPGLMSLEQLYAYIQTNELPIETALYGDASDLRQALIDYNTDPDAFLETQNNRLELRKTDLDLKSDLAILNPNIGAPTIPTITPVDPITLPGKLDIRQPAAATHTQRPGDTLTKDPTTGEMVPTETFTEAELAAAEVDEDDALTGI